MSGSERGIGGVRQIDRHGLIALVASVADHGDVDVLRRLPGLEGERAGRRGVVLGLMRAAIGGGEIDGDPLPARRVQRRRIGQGGGSCVAFGDRAARDRDRWGRVVIDDRAHPLPVADGGVGGAAEVHGERLVVFVQAVAAHRDVNRLGRLARSECHLAARARVVRGRRGGRIRRRMAHRHGVARGTGEGDDELAAHCRRRPQPRGRR